ncbi:GumC family protein [Terricaulis silvestris]|nr:AAA family ATPase [Terricaulis silvestris]
MISITRGAEDFREQSVGPEEDQGAQIKRVYGVFMRRWRVMLAVAVVVYAAVVANTMLSPKIYTATALIMVNPAGQQVLSQDQTINTGPSYEDAAVESEIEVLTSIALSARLVEAMQLERDPEWNGALRPPGPVASALAPIRALISNDGADVEPRVRDIEAEREGIAAAFNGALSVKRRGFSYAIELSLDSRNPRRAAELLNRLTEVYLQMQTEARFEASQRANDWLSHRLEELRQEVQAKEQAAETFRSQNGLSLAAGGGANQTPQSAEVQTMMVSARADLAEKDARLRQVRRLLETGGSAESLATTLNSPVVGELRSRETDLAQRVAELRQRYSAEHPTILAAESELENVRQRIQLEVSRITASLQNEVEIARARLNTLQGSFGGVAGSNDDDNGAVIHYRELLRDATAARSVHESFLQRFHEVADQGDLPIATSRILSAARTPGAPSKPNLSRAMLVALVFAGMCGAGIGFLIEMLDASIASAEDAERKLNVAAIASVPVLRPRDLSGIAPHRRKPADYLVDKPASGFAEAFRVLKTSLMHARVDRRLKVLAVTSAVPAEGKTTVSLCLARIAAMSGQRVILVDCDLRRHSLSEAVGVSPSLGLLDVLSGGSDWRGAAVQDPESAAQLLAVLPSRFNPRDVFDSVAMEQLLDDLRAHFDLVVLDCPPVLAVAETRTVAKLADLTLMVVRSDKTPTTAARMAIREISQAGADIGGVALNWVNPRRRGGYGDTLYYSYASSYYHS